MSDLDIKKLNGLTDEHERRIKNLEASKVNKDLIVTVEQSEESLLFDQKNNSKIFKFTSNDDSYVIVKLRVTSNATFDVNQEIYLNGKLQIANLINFPFECEIPLKPRVGENQIKIVLNSNSTTKFKLDMYLSVKGNIVQSEKAYELGASMDEYVYLKTGDTVKGINTDTMETVVCYSGKQAVASCFLTGNYFAYLHKEDGVAKLERHIKGSSDSYKTVEGLESNYTDCSIEINNGYTYIYMLRGEIAYLYGYLSSTSSFLQKLPFRASRIFVFAGATGRYLYYTDLRGNCTVIKHYSYTNFRLEKTISLGKLKNARLSEENGKLVVLYKQGLVVVKKPVFENAEPTVVGIGDEAVITKNGVTVIRQSSKLIKL
ncbi:MAG: hypothetical protein IKA61_04945 [Clostridia bacterium]|nr:hypothetical protein [Clostridia bacterium]